MSASGVARFRYRASIEFPPLRLSSGRAVIVLCRTPRSRAPEAGPHELVAHGSTDPSGSRAAVPNERRSDQAAIRGTIPRSGTGSTTLGEMEPPAPVSRAEGGFQRHRGRRECSGLFDLVPDSGLFRIDAGFLLRHPDVVITGRNLFLDRRRLTDEPRSVGGSGSEAPAQLLAGTVRPNRALSKPSS